MKLARAGVAVGVILSAGPSAAQVIIGGDTDGQPSVIVDESVLDALGPPRGFVPPSPHPAAPAPPSHPVDLRPEATRAAATVAEPPSWRPPLPGRRPDPEVATVAVTDSAVDDTVGTDPPDVAADTPAEAAEPPAMVEQREPDQADREPAEPGEGEDAPTAGRPALTVVTQPLGAGLLVNSVPPDAESGAEEPADTDTPDETAATPVEPPPAEPPVEPELPADQVAETPGASAVAAAPPAEPPAEPPSADLTLSIPFDVGADSLDQDALDLLSGVADRMTASPEPRLSIVAYATGDAGTARNARSLSLTRALAVREYLMMQGVRLTRIDMRALGDTADGDPRDRIDLELNY